MKNILTEKEQIDDFDKTANNSNAWFTKTRSLHLAAKKLFEIYKNTVSNLQKETSGIAPISINFIDQVLLLEGFAIECLLKGLYVADGNKISKNGELKKITSKKHHDLIELCNINNVDLDDREKSIIETLSLMVISYGRYPTPIKYSVNPRTYDKENGYSPIYIFHYDDLVLIDNLIISVIGDLGDY